MRTPHIYPDQWLIRWLLMGALVCGCLLLPPKAEAQEKRARVALGVFRGGEDNYARRAAIEALTEQTFAVLSARGTDEWLERSQIEAATAEAGLARRGALDPGATITVGRWLRAEMVVLGALREAANGEGELRLQVAETETADVLAESTLPLAGGPAEWMGRPAGEKVAGTIIRLLEHAKLRRRLLAGRVRIAIPFFQSERGGRLDGLGERIRAACQAAGAASRNLRVMNFPASAASRGEEDLALAGLAEPSPAMLGVELADAWAWGLFEEIASSGVPFPEVRVEVKLFVWRAGRLRQETVPGRAGQLDVLARDVAAKTLALAQANGGQEQAMSREEVGRMLYGVADNWITELLPMGVLESSDGRARHRALVRMLELATFFAPSEARIARELLVERWREDLFGNNRLGLYENLALSEAWGRHCEAYGFELRLPDGRRRADFTYTDNRNPHREPAAAYVAFEAAAIAALSRYSRDGDRETTMPPPAVARQWLADRQRELLRRLEYLQKSAVQDPTGAVAVFEYLGGLGAPEYSLRVADRLASLFSGQRIPDWRKNQAHREVNAVLRAAGDPRTAAQLLGFDAPDQPAKSTVHPPVRQSLAETEHGAERAATLSTLVLPPTFTVAWKPQYLAQRYIVQDTVVLRVASGALWVGTHGVQKAENGDFGTYEPSLWRRELRTGTTAKIRSFDAGFNQVADVASDGRGRAWVGMENGGLWSGADSGGTLTEHRVGEGVGDPRVFSLATDGEALWVGGGDEPAGILSRFDFRKQVWTTFDLGFSPPGETERPPQVRFVACAQNRVLVAGHSGGVRDYAAILDPARKTWHLLDGPEFAPGMRWRDTVSAVVGDGTGFWVGTPLGLFLVEPTTGRPTNLNLPVAPADAVVTAMCKDGDWLWVATDIRANDRKSGQNNSVARHLFVLHQPTGKWVGSVAVEGTSPIQQVAASADKIWIAFYNDVDTPYYESVKPIFTPPARR